MSPRLRAASDSVAGLEPGRVERWQPASLSIDPWVVLRLARYRRRDAVPPPIWEATTRMTARAEALVTPRAWLRPVRIAVPGPGGVRLAEGPAFSGSAVGALLAGCPVAVTFVLTLGPELETETAVLAERRELLEAFLLDTAGWAAIEGAVRALRFELGARARALGRRVTHRFAPGYRDWPLEEQRALIGLFDGAEAPVRLNDYGVLVPFKSITGVFGVRPLFSEAPQEVHRAGRLGHAAGRLEGDGKLVEGLRLR